MKISKVLLILFTLFVTVTTINAEDTPGYPVKDFLGCTIFNEVKVSPNGKHIAIITATDDFDNDHTDTAIWRIDIDGMGNKTDMIRLTHAEGGYFGLRWSPDERYLSFLSTRKPAEAPQLFALDMQGGEPILLTDPKKFKEGVNDHDWLPDGSGIIFAAPDPPSEEQEKKFKEFYGDAIRYAPQKPSTSFWNIAVAGFQKQDAKLLKTVDIAVDRVLVSPDGKWIAYVSSAPRKPLAFYSSMDEIEVFLLSTKGDEPPRQLTHNFVWEVGIQWIRDGSGLYFSGSELDAKWYLNSQGRLYRVDLKDGQTDSLVPGFIGEFDYPFSDGNFVQMPDGSLLSNATISTRTNIHIVDPSKGETKLLTDYSGDVVKLSASRDGKLIAFALVTSEFFPEVHIAEGIENLMKAHRITDFNAKLSQMPKPEIETIRWENGEGDTIEGVLYWPPGHRGEKNLPMVIDIHGGPWIAKTETLYINHPAANWMSYPTILASRGYLVLDPNYRGGTGRGDKFTYAIECYAGSRPSTDILTGVDYIVSNGWADPQLMGVVGYSYGGVLTAYLITLTDRFKVACSGAGIWNWISYFGTSDCPINLDIYFHNKMSWENFQNYWQESAISRAGNIKTPTLIVFGGVDRRVPTTQGLELYRALVRLGVPTELLVFPEEEHMFQKPSHKLTKVKAEIAWLDHYLLGKPLPDIK